ncbi:alanyl-tRNA editing protein [Fusobacterium sp. PH5-44]|uniref:alanyl-tRNA editing protein n=1 Tax=unclassified Fusobacterium TaxID=2648384 RepID=UPI003D195696
MQLEIITCKPRKDKFLITIRENPFYIDGKGGQLGDRGEINGLEVLQVTEEGVLLKEEIHSGIYEYNIDENRKIHIGENHTAQHLFSAIAYKLFGLNTVSFRMAEEYSTVDLDSLNITEEIIEKMEKLTNDYIKNDIPIDIYILPHDEAIKKKGLRKNIKDKVTGDVRFVEIKGMDISACAGYHVKSTKDIRLFKILYFEKIKGAFTRFYFIAGEKAIEDYNNKHKILRNLCHKFSCREREIEEMIEKILEDRKNIEGQLKNISIKYAEKISQELMGNSINLNNNMIIFYDAEKSIAPFLNRFVDLDNYLLITAIDNAYTFMSNKVNCKELLNFILSKSSNVKGGGSINKGNLKGELRKDELLNIIKLFFCN